LLFLALLNLGTMVDTAVEGMRMEAAAPRDELRARRPIG